MNSAYRRGRREALKCKRNGTRPTCPYNGESLRREWREGVVSVFGEAAISAWEASI
jgi:hypothetical protein